MSSGLHFLLLPGDSLDASTGTARGLMIECSSGALLSAYRSFLPYVLHFCAIGTHPSRQNEAPVLLPLLYY